MDNYIIKTEEILEILSIAKFQSAIDCLTLQCKYLEPIKFAFLYTNEDSADKKSAEEFINKYLTGLYTNNYSCKTLFQNSLNSNVMFSNTAKAFLFEKKVEVFFDHMFEFLWQDTSHITSLHNECLNIVSNGNSFIINYLMGAENKTYYYWEY